MNDSFIVAVEELLDDATRDAVRFGLRDYNLSKAPTGYASVGVIARDAAGTVVGGALGWTAWGELYVDILWVADAARGHGVGTRLMAGIEEQARAHECQRVHLGTMSHQAPDFYPRVGYSQCGFFPGANGWPDRYMFYKDLPENVDTPAASESPS